MRSLSGQLALWGLPLLVALVILEALLAYRDARAATTRAHDRALAVALSDLAAAPPRDPATLAAARARLAAGLGVSPDDAHVAVFDSHGRLLAGEGDLPFARPASGRDQAFSDGHHLGEPVRAGARRLAAASPDEPALIVAAENAAPRARAILSLALGEARRFAVGAAIALALLVVWRRRALAELDRPAKRLAARQAEDLSPLPLDDAPAELRPLIGAVNLHLERLAGLLEASRRFAADVAHQLRTPLTLLGAQAQYGLRQRQPEALRTAMEEIAAASRGAQRLCNQMLTLSRVEAAKGAVRDGVLLDLAELVRETALDLSLLALEKDVDLAYEDGGGAAFVFGDEIMLRELFSNLIDNALRYTPSQGRVRVTLARAGGRVEAMVIDGGPGVPPERRDAVLQRFHRRLDRGAGSGAGLGLAIAHQIARAHGGMIGFEDVPDGFAVRVTLPERQDPAPLDN